MFLLLYSFRYDQNSTLQLHCRCDEGGENVPLPHASLTVAVSCPERRACAHSPHYRFRQGQETNLINRRAHTQRNLRSPLSCLTQEIGHGDHAESWGRFQVHSTLTRQRNRRPQSEKGMWRDFLMALHPRADVRSSLKLHLFEWRGNAEFQQIGCQRLPPMSSAPLRSAVSVHHLMWTLQN